MIYPPIIIVSITYQILGFVNSLLIFNEILAFFQELLLFLKFLR